MSEPLQGASGEPVAVHRCHYCGTEHKADVRYCAECKRYQPDPPGTPPPRRSVVRCRTCRELIPRGASKCNQCSAFQRGIGRWLPTSAATISALGALASLVILLLNTVANRPPAPRSETTLDIIGYESAILSVRASNAGTRPSVVGRGWAWLEPTNPVPPALSDCGVHEGPDQPCSRVSTAPPDGTLPLNAVPLTTLVYPGYVLVPFVRKRSFEANELREELLPCATFDVAIKQFHACLAFEVIEHQGATRRCIVHALSNLSKDHYLGFIKDATLCKS